MQSAPVKRRTFLAWLAALPAAFGFGCRACRDEAPSAAPETKAPQRPPLATLSDDEARTLRPMLERLIPRTASPASPGADETDLIVYLDRALGDPHFHDLRALVGKGALYLDAIARRHHDKRFREISPPEQDAILADFQAGRVPGLRFAQTRFFEVVHTFALEGFFGDPAHGGNRQSLAWKWIGMSTTCGHSKAGS